MSLKNKKNDNYSEKKTFISVLKYIFITNITFIASDRIEFGSLESLFQVFEPHHLARPPVASPAPASRMFYGVNNDE